MVTVKVINKFIEVQYFQVTVLPPGEWDPNIRIEPPNKVPSQDKRKHCDELLLTKISAPKKVINSFF